MKDLKILSQIDNRKYVGYKETRKKERKRMKNIKKNSEGVVLKKHECQCLTKVTYSW